LEILYIFSCLILFQLDPGVQIFLPELFVTHLNEQEVIELIRRALVKALIDFYVYWNLWLWVDEFLEKFRAPRNLVLLGTIEVI